MELQTQNREVLGKKVKDLRGQGLVPAELYGHGISNTHLMINGKEFNQIYKEVGESTIITLITDGKKVPVLIYNVEFDPMSQKISHIDFYAVKMDEKVKIAIALEFVGESQAVKQGGVLVKSMKELEVEALPKDLPSSIEVDLAKLENLHDSIFIKDLNIDKKVKVLVDEENVVATVIEPAKEEEVVAEAKVEDVKVEGEEKKKVKEEEAGK